MADHRPKIMAIIEQALRDEFGKGANYYRTEEKILVRGGEKLIPPTHGAYILACGDASKGLGLDLVQFEVAVAHVVLGQDFELLVEERMVKGGVLMDLLVSLVEPGRNLTVPSGDYADDYRTDDYLLQIASWRIPMPFEKPAGLLIPGMALDSGVYLRWAAAGVTYVIPPSF